ncbi:RagB/SusD family nutrient uptake outer membrane protein [Gynurincola endophyticus]|uniref:RagB/SusD family nutrient uptake outer membrane protein n=1 Tax=Gynurincola endophyticus TaxID=2479004 RepID=UPI000F8DC3C1|nr:RagB/SusD family nutrient uptake outer membrane protein [Gynurincola endophyticus]
MKRFKNKLLTAVVAAALLGSCSKDYLETKPTDAVLPEAVFATATDAIKVVDGMYRMFYAQIQGSQALGGIGGHMIYMEVLADDVVMTGQSNGWFISDYRWVNHRVPTNSSVKYHYLYPYTFIINANYLLENIDAAEGTTTDKDYVTAQAKALRAFSYFNLVQVFGKRYDPLNVPNEQLGVPLKTSSNEKEILPRASVEDVYGLIVKDLEDAIGLFTTTRKDKSHMNVRVAQGLLARVYLTMGKWQEAADLANAARQGFTLMSEDQYMSGFNDYSNQEWMWGTHQIAEHNTYFYNFFAYMSANFNSTNIRTNPKAISERLYNMMSPTDFRRNLWDPTGTNTAFPIPASTAERKPYMNRKFLVPDVNMSNADYPLMRAAEMYLIEAEALAHLGSRDADAAQVLFELVSMRDPGYTLSTNTGTDLLEEILVQRRIELWGEGFRFKDLKRLNLPLDRNNSNHNASLAANIFDVPAGDIRWEFLIPQAEINYTAEIVVQNPL